SASGSAPPSAASPSSPSSPSAASASASIAASSSSVGSGSTTFVGAGTVATTTSGSARNATPSGGLTRHERHAPPVRIPEPARRSGVGDGARLAVPVGDARTEPLLAHAARLGRAEPLAIGDDELGAFSGHSGGGV